jgi:hypothetical protein
MKFLRSIKSWINADLLQEAHTSKIALGQSSILTSKASRGFYRELWDSEVKVFSQWGEDGILWFICDILEIAKPRILEIGAGNFTECNSRFLAEARNAAVYLVDSRPDLAQEVNGLDLLWKNNIFANEVWVTPNNSREIFENAKSALGSIDILSLDIDGIDYWVMAELDLTGVSIVVVEYNPIFGAKFPITVPKTEFFDRTKAHSSWLYFGASIRAWVDFFEKKNFVFVGTNRVGNNAFFVSRGSEEIFKYINKVDPTLSKYVDWQVRESRDKNGSLDYSSLAQSKSRICKMPVTLIENFNVEITLNMEELDMRS